VLKAQWLLIDWCLHKEKAIFQNVSAGNHNKSTLYEDVQSYRVYGMPEVTIGVCIPHGRSRPLHVDAIW